MAGEETCRVVRRHRDEGPVSEKNYFWFEAVLTDANGEHVVARSREWLHGSLGLIQMEDEETIRARNVQWEAASRAELIQTLISDGWQASGFNDRGLPNRFSRPAQVAATPPFFADKATLLKALDDLRLAGLLSSDEYETKKEQVLARDR
jgi:hypothetical protein